MKRALLIALLCYSIAGLYAQTKSTYVAPVTKMTYDVWKTTEKYPYTEYGEKRFALVIGVANYLNGANLPNNRNDVRDMTSALNAAGFDVMVVSDPTLEEMMDAVMDARSLYRKSAYNVALVYFTGHGAQMGGTNLLMPSDAVFTSTSSDEHVFKQFFERTMLLSDVVGVFDQEQTRQCICIVDACRSYDYIIRNKGSEMVMDINLLNRLNLDNEKVEMAGKNSVFYPAKASSATPANGPNGKNSHFTYFVLKEWEKKPSTLGELAQGVIKAMKGQGSETPVIKLGVHDYDFQVFPKNARISTVESHSGLVPIESPMSKEDTRRIDGGVSYSVLNANVPAPIRGLVETFEKLEGGIFQMGCSLNDDQCGTDEGPIGGRTTRVAPFSIGRYEITQEQYFTVMNANPSANRGCLQCPVENVSWNDAKTFIAKLNEMTGLRFRLPYEAEWEFAARGGTTSRYHTGDCISTSDANFNATEQLPGCVRERGFGKTLPVGSGTANAYGLYDMSGNVYEWCEDAWKEESSFGTVLVGALLGADTKSTTMRAIRGGSWYYSARGSRVSNRVGYEPETRSGNVGIRLVLENQ